MTALDTNLLPAILSLLDRLGKTVTVHDVPGAVNVSTGRVSGTPDSWSVKVTPPAPVKQSLVDGDVVQTRDAAMLVAAQDIVFTPTIGQRVVVDSLSYKVVKVIPLYSGELICAYRLIARQ